MVLDPTTLASRNPDSNPYETPFDGPNCLAPLSRSGLPIRGGKQAPLFSRRELNAIVIHVYDNYNAASDLLFDRDILKF